MNKETFIAAIKAIELQFEHDKKCSEAFETILPSDHVSFYDNHWLTNALVMVLQEAFNDTKPQSWIEYYLWELDFGKENYRLKASRKDGSNIPLSTPEELYDFLIEIKEE